MAFVYLLQVLPTDDERNDEGRTAPAGDAGGTGQHAVPRARTLWTPASFRNHHAPCKPERCYQEMGVWRSAHLPGADLAVPAG